MKSVIVKDKKGKLLIKVVDNQDGSYDLVKTPEIDRDCNIQVRNDKGKLVKFGGWK